MINLKRNLIAHIQFIIMKVMDPLLELAMIFVLATLQIHTRTLGTVIFVKTH
jgi:hypothetical protein